MTTSTASATSQLLRSRPPHRPAVRLPRQIDQLSFAWLLNERPSHIPKAKRSRGAMAAGNAYEKKVVREIKNRLKAASWSYHQWIQFNDRNGRGWAEPEVYAVLADRVILFEAKLTGGPAGRMQMEGLYKPLLEFIYKRPVVCCMVCKYITSATPGPFFGNAEDFIRSGESYGCWHWLGL